ncbi:MAG: TRAP transporter substrate-binding protein [Pseudomonas sp.]|nr:TRAP transporter substrate-binding protein [Pseudomonas sp.]
MALFNKALTAAALAVAGILGSAAVQAENLRLAHIVPPSHVWHQVAERFSAQLDKESAGRFATRISPQAKLGRDPQLIKLLQSGGIQFAILTAGDLSNRSESMQAWFLPYTFTDVAHAGAAARTPAAREMLQQLDGHGMVGLGYAFAGMRHVLSTKPVRSPADLHNKKIRSFPNEIYSDWWQANGAAPTALPLSEVSPSLTTNLLDAVDVDLDVVVGLKFYQQAGNLALTNHMAFPGVMVVSKKWWDRQSSEDRELIGRVFAEAEAWGIQKQVEAEAANLKTLKDAGVNVEEIALAPFQSVGKDIAAKYTARNPTIKAFAEQAAALAN